MSDKIKLLHRATRALYLELPESVANDFTGIQQAAIEELQARNLLLEKVAKAAKGWTDGKSTDQRAYYDILAALSKLEHTTEEGQR